MARDNFAVRRTATILGAAAIVVVAAIAIAVVAIHRQPPKPALGSGDTTASAVALAMPSVDPNSPVVARPAPPGQSVPLAPVTGPEAVAPIPQAAGAVTDQTAGGQVPAQDVAPAAMSPVAPARATVRVTGIPQGAGSGPSTVMQPTVLTPSGRPRLHRKPLARDTEAVNPSDVQAAPPDSSSPAPARVPKRTAKPDTARSPAPADTSD